MLRFERMISILPLAPIMHFGDPFEPAQTLIDAEDLLDDPSPCTDSVEIRDTDGDIMVFKLAGRRLSMSVNGRLVVPRVTTLLIDETSGKVTDPMGRFTIPEEDRASKIALLHGLLHRAGGDILPSGPQTADPGSPLDGADSRHGMVQRAWAELGAPLDMLRSMHTDWVRRTRPTVAMPVAVAADADTVPPQLNEETDSDSILPCPPPLAGAKVDANGPLASTAPSDPDVAPVVADVVPVITEKAGEETLSASAKDARSAGPLKEEADESTGERAIGDAAVPGSAQTTSAEDGQAVAAAGSAAAAKGGRQGRRSRGRGAQC